MPALEQLYGGEGKVSEVLIEVADGTDVMQASSAIKTLYANLGTPVVTTSAEEMSQRIMGVLGGIQTSLTAIAAIALAVALRVRAPCRKVSSRWARLPSNCGSR